jgi:uncharacterized 2Fe-2S/4Fe-4S cluster protein (DUF4445 family)
MSDTVLSSAHLTPFSEPEELYRARGELAPGRRLGCHTRLLGDVVVDVPPESQLHRQVVRKDADARAIDLDPVLRLHHLEVEEPSLGAQRSDLARLLEALEREWRLTGLGGRSPRAADAPGNPQSRQVGGDRGRARRLHDHRRLARLP